MMLQIDPAYAPVWRDPFTLQLGVDEPQAVLTNVTPQDEQFVSLLKRGMSVATLEHFAGVAGISPERGRELVDTLRAVLMNTDSALPNVGGGLGLQLPLDLRWSGEETTRAGLLLSLLRTVGLEPQRPQTPGTTSLGLGLIIADYVALPRQSQHWLSNDQPHTALVFSDQTIRWGPIVPAQTGGCLLCPELSHRERDSAWPAIATQAHELHAPTHSPELEALAYAGLTADLGAWRRATLSATRPGTTGSQHPSSPRPDPTAQHPLAGRVAVLNARTRRVSYRQAVRHPDCGCAQGTPLAGQTAATTGT